MRNIKTSLRFVRNSALLFVAASGMTYLTACSETDITPDNGGNNNGDENVLVEQLKVNAGSNPSLAKSYYNSHLGTRAAWDVPEHPGMPEAPSAEELAAMNPIDASTNVYSYSGYNGTPNFYVKGDVNFNQLATVVYVQDASTNWQQVPVQNVRYFIDGNVSFNGFGGDENTPIEVHILNGGKLSAGTNIPYATTIYLYGGGDIVKASNQGDKIIYHKGSLIAEEDLIHGDTDITIEGNVYTYGKIHGKNVTLIGGEVFAGCAVTAEDTIYLTGNDSNVSAGYVSAPTIQLSGNSPLYISLRDGGYLHATEKLNLTNIGNVFVKADEGEYAMVEAASLSVNNEDLQGTMYNVAVKFDGIHESTNLAGANGENILWNNTCQVNGDIVDYAVVDGDDCGPKMVVNPNDNPTPDPDPVLENVGSVAPSDGDQHTHPISATCIYTNGQDAYLSWHTQGPNFHGCIEYLTVANGTVTLNSYLETSPSNDTYGAVDFNHVIFDNGKIFVAGDHPKKGGILGWIECNDGKFVTGEAVLNIRQLYNEQGGSGNCIIRNGDYYQVASVKGFETFNVSDFSAGAKPKSIAKLAAYDFSPEGMTADGNKISGKHIATDGKNVVMLTLINRDNAANTATASIKVYAASDVNYENEIASYIVSDAVLAPVDGKDVIAIQGNDIWVCLGQGGVQHLTLAGNTITKKAEFVLTNMTKEELKGWEMTTKEAAASCANGLAVDGKYVYVAHGGAGLIVLNKEDLSFVTRTKYNGGNSANYVNLNPDGYIYVAYGKSNVQVFAWKK